jgi:integrase
MNKLRRSRDELSKRTRAPNTERAYGSAWKGFASWCRETGRQSLPATDETISLFIAALITERGARLATAVLAVSAINDAHVRAGLPKAAGPKTSALMSGSRRSIDEDPAGKAAMTLDALKEALRELEKKGTVASRRDAAILLLGFGSGLRRAELSALNISHVKFVPKGLQVWVARAKTDQTGKGREICIPPGSLRMTCPVESMRAWLVDRGNKPGALFTRIVGKDAVTTARLRPPAICAIVQRAAKAAGLDASRYGAHSLRSGLVTTAAEEGANHLAIMGLTGHRSPKTLMRYFRPVEGFASYPLAKAL